MPILFYSHRQTLQPLHGKTRLRLIPPDSQPRQGLTHLPLDSQPLHISCLSIIILSIQISLAHPYLYIFNTHYTYLYIISHLILSLIYISL